MDALSSAAWLATDQGDRASAIPLLDESIERARATHDVVREDTALYYRGRAKQVIGDPAGGGQTLNGRGSCRPTAAATPTSRRPCGGPGLRQCSKDDLGLAIERFERFAELSGALGLLAPGQAIALGLDDKPEDRWRGGPSASLTRREREIAALVATGLTNRQIAGQLYLSVRTVEVHVDHILTKLGFRTRTQLAAWMHEEGLAPRIT